MKTCMVLNLVLIVSTKGVNPRSIAPLQNRIIEVQDQTLYGSESNLNCNDGRGSETSLSKQTSKNARIGDENLYGPRSSVDIMRP